MRRAGGGTGGYGVGLMEVVQMAYVGVGRGSKGVEWVDLLQSEDGLAVVGWGVCVCVCVVPMCSI